MAVTISRIGAPSDGHNNLGWRLWGACVVMIVFAGLFVIARIATRLHIRQIGPDDYAIILSLLCAVVLVSCWTLSVSRGYGMPVDDFSQAQFTAYLKWFFIGQPFYLATVSLNKISVILLSKRVFVQRYFQIICWTLLTLVCLIFTIIFFLTVFQCKPVSTMWGIAPLTAECIEINKMLTAWAASNLATDILILIAPVPMVWQLNLKGKEKILLTFVFLLGAITTVCSVLSAHNLVKGIENIAHNKYSFAGSNLFQVLEMHIGIIGACLPVLQHPIRAAFPKLFSTRIESRQDGQPYYYEGFRDYYDMSKLSKGSCSSKNESRSNWHRISVSAARKGSDEIGIVRDGKAILETERKADPGAIQKYTTVSIKRAVGRA